MAKGVVLVGEPMGLFIAQNEGPLDEAAAYTMAVAGAEFNVAVGLARLQHKATYLTKLGNDPFGKRIARVLAQNNIGNEFVSYSNTRFTGLMLKSKVSRGDPEIFYLRKNSAASTLEPADFEQMDFSNYSYLHLTGILPALTPSTRKAAFALVEKAKKSGLAISFDPNLRPQLWPSREEMVEVVNRLAAQADIVLPGISEGEILCGCRDKDAISDFYLRLGAGAVITKLGADGAYVATKKTRQLIPGFTVENIVDTVGAGDGFAAGVLSALLEGHSLAGAVQRGNAVGAMQLMSAGDNEGLPSREQLAAFMGLDTI